MNELERAYSGADWLKPLLDYEMSQFGTKVADLVGDWQMGIYHLPVKTVTEKVDWTNDYFIQLPVRATLCSFDDNSLTRLLVLCHDRFVRLEINGRTHGWLNLNFTMREGREGNFAKRHPTMEDAMLIIRAHYEKREKRTYDE